MLVIASWKPARLETSVTEVKRIPIIGITMGDAAGVGPEVAVRACLAVEADAFRPLLIGHPDVFRRAAELVSSNVELAEVDRPDEVSANEAMNRIACWNPGLDAGIVTAPNAEVSAASGAAAYASLIAAIGLAKAGTIDAITTAPLNKEALHTAGHHFPGHTEILAHECGVTQFAMLLFLPEVALRGMRELLGSKVERPAGLGVAHCTLHTSVASVPGLLTTERILGRIRLMHEFLRKIGSQNERVGVCALNPHGGENGLFGDEEQSRIAPAVEAAQREGIDAAGPFPTDTLVRRAVMNEFGGLVAMYHDQGHIPFKLIGFDQAVNITLGLPIIRTSPSHGTAYDIAWKGKADATGMGEALRIAASLARNSNKSIE